MKKTSKNLNSKKVTRYMAAAVVISLGFNSMASAQENLVKKVIPIDLASETEADKTIMSGRQAYIHGDYKKAVVEYNRAISLLPDDPNTAKKRKAYIADLLEGSIALSNQYRRMGKNDEAKELFKKIIAKDPENKDAKKALEYLNDPIRKNPTQTLTLKHVAKLEKVRKHTLRGDNYFNEKEFDHAMIEYRKVERLDPYNKAVSRKMVKVTEAKAKAHRVEAGL